MVESEKSFKDPEVYDYIVIGAGSGGMASGRRAALFG
jgi:pyruvate/2-oxoglutarate dehydrogenase complex dihydrolipoamide dehydrogenase (E3) component